MTRNGCVTWIGALGFVALLSACSSSTSVTYDCTPACPNTQQCRPVCQDGGVTINQCVTANGTAADGGVVNVCGTAM